MFLSLGIIFVIGFLGGWLFEKIHLPKLVFYILLGILIGPSLWNIVSPDLLAISSYLRQIALVLILTRSGLSLNIKTLKEIGRPAILMCFLPAVFEIIGVTIFAPLFFSISYVEALLLGSVLAAVSPAVVVPRMISLQEKGYGKMHHVPELIMAGASCDDIFVIVLFYSFLGALKQNTWNAFTLLSIPTSILLGLALGVIMAIPYILLLKKVSIPHAFKVILLLGLSFLMLGIETLLKPYVAVSSLLGVILLGILVLAFIPKEAPQIQKSYNQLWSGFEILLFTLVGCATNIHYALSKEGAILFGVIALALVFRSFGVFLCILKTEYTKKEKLFIIFSYLPKATVQASIGALALTEGLACGELVLTGAVISILFTAPLGAILMDSFDKKLLIEKEKPLVN